MADITETGKRIEQARINAKLTQEELALELGLNKSTIQRYESGKIQKIKLPIVEAMAKILKVSPLWLSGKIENAVIESNAEVLPATEIRMIPVFETVSAGFGAYASSDIVDYIPLYIESDYEAEETLCIKVKGDSMYPKIEDGDIIQVHKQDSIENGQIAVVLVDNEEGLVKKMYVYSDYLELHSINPEYPVKTFEKEQMNRIKIVGIVRKIIKEC